LQIPRWFYRWFSSDIKCALQSFAWVAEEVRKEPENRLSLCRDMIPWLPNANQECPRTTYILFNLKFSLGDLCVKVFRVVMPCVLVGRYWNLEERIFYVLIQTWWWWQHVPPKFETLLKAAVWWNAVSPHLSIHSWVLSGAFSFWQLWYRFC
jgi:hypothetical protein